MRWRLFGLFLLSVPAWSANENFQSQRQFANNGGKFDHISPFLVPGKNAQTIQNFMLDDRGQLSKRQGYLIENTTGTLGPTTSNMLGSAWHTSTSGGNFFTVIIGSDVFRTQDVTQAPTKITGSVSLSSAVTNLAQATQLQDSVVFCNEVDTPIYVTSSGNATTISTNTISNAKTCSTYNTYWILGNTTEAGTKYPSRVRWSDPDNINSLPALNFIDVQPDDGDKIVTMVAYEDSVYIFKQYSIYRMLITGSDGPNAFIIRPIARGVGGWAKKSIQVIPGLGIIFLAQNTIYLLNGSYASQYTENGLKPIGDPIQRTLDTVNRSSWSVAVGALYPKRYQYWLAVSTTGTNSNQMILVYDYIQNAWTTYSGINASDIAQAQKTDGTPVLMTGDYSGNVYLQDQGTADLPKNVSTNIDAIYATGEIHLDAPEITKGWKYLYLFDQVDSTATITVSAAYDYTDSFTFSQNVSAAPSGTVAVYDTAVYGTDIYSGGVANKTWQRLELNQSAKSIRLQFENNSKTGAANIIGWVLAYTIEGYRE